MSMNKELIRENVMRDQAEGVIALGFDGTISYLNPAAGRILGMDITDMQGKRFVEFFLEHEENDDFVQTVLDAIYDKKHAHNEVVPFFTGAAVRQLHVMTSFLYDGSAPAGVIVVLNDITELAELKIEYARQMTSLLDSLVGALSTAIDERSPYNAHHTRNMVRFAERFLDYLAETGSDWKFDEDKRRAFLMSVWLHDVGKLAVPLEVMDKSTRLGPALSAIESRFTEMELLDRVAVLEGRLDAGKGGERKTERAEALAFVRRINTQGFLPDADLAVVEGLADRTYVNAGGEKCPWFTAAELDALRIRKGTLTDEERAVMQSHVSVTDRILGHVDFPEVYAKVPVWAASHHELLNGRGYPKGRAGEDIPREVRLLTILDVFEALTAKDRPYKPGMPPEKALGILHSMVKEGAVDAGVLERFEASRAWEGVE